MKSIELFAGIGGIALAAEWAGIETVAFCEREPFCQKVLNKHWSNVPIFNDVCTLNKRALEERSVDVGTIDIISGGFPCQPYSIAGEKKGKEDERDLWPEMFRIIQEIRPTWVVGENVANFVNMELERTCIDLESEGYKVQAFIIPAMSVNAPHKRNRVFVVAHLSDSSCLGHQGIERLRENLDEIEKWGESSLRTTPKLFDDIDWKERARESGFLGGDYGIPHRMDRIRALGNAVVPQQIYPIFKYIMEIERMNKQ